MAAGLKRDPIVILRMDGEDLLEYLKSPSSEPEILSFFSEIDVPDGSYQDYIIRALEKLTVEQGMPPVSDSWVSIPPQYAFWYNIMILFITRKHK